MSQFIDQHRRSLNNVTEELIFDDAVKLHGSGSTCDIYRTRWQCREVFVKRLKPQLASKPVYLDAIKKEFEIGAALSHPSLPYYREFHGDYIVLDYIDGITLADMIAAHDPWLADETNIVKLLRQLVEVVDYLHRHNVVHCDIKPDNIMITACGKNLVLIDLDKCYTDALNDTMGHPGKYGLAVEDAGRVKVDFYGIAHVLDAIMANESKVKFRGYKRFVETCRSEGASCQKLLNILDRSRSKYLWWWVTGGIIIVALIVASSQFRQQPPVKEITKVEYSEKSEKSEGSEQSEQSEHSESSEHSEKSQADLHIDAKSKAGRLDQRVEESFALLHSSLDGLEALRADSTVSQDEFIDALCRHSNREDETVTEAFATLYDMYPGTTEREAWRIMAYSKAYTTYKRRMSEFEKRLERGVSIGD